MEIKKMTQELRHIQSSFYIDISKVRPSPVFFHVGTFTGKLESRLIELFPTCKIYSFEPHPDNFKSLIKNTKNLSNVERINSAIVTNENLHTIRMDGTGSCATTYQVNSGIEVPAVTIEKFIDENRIDIVDAIFYNAEGSEMDFIPYIVERSLSRKVLQICLNFHVHVPRFKISYPIVEKLLSDSNIRKHYDVNDDRNTKIATKATGKNLSEKYPCFLFVSKEI